MKYLLPSIALLLSLVACGAETAHPPLSAADHPASLPLPAPIFTTKVASLPALQKALDIASPGQKIILADGTYTSTGPITISKAGTAEHPIIITCESLLGAEIKGKAGFTFTKTASYVVLTGFVLTHDSVAMSMPTGADHCRITRNVFAFQNNAKAPEITVSGDDNEFAYNTFKDKQTEGPMITVQGPGTSGMALHTWIHHNLFSNFMPTANNCSAIQIGLSGRSLSSAYSLTEYNLFIQCRGENEGAVCNKSCDNIYRYNTFADGTRELSLRHGNRCQVYANFFINADGLRFFGHDHLIYSNYFEHCERAINIGNGDGIVPKDKLTSHDKPVGEQVSFNTLINNKVNIMLGNRRNGLGAANITITSNIIQGGLKAAVIAGPLENPTWQGNVVWKTTDGPGDMPTTGFISIDPQLKQSPNGIYRPTPASPAIVKAIEANQLSASSVANHVLTITDVGPAAASAAPIFSSKTLSQ